MTPEDRRNQTEERLVRRLIKLCLDGGHKVSVCDGEEWTLRMSSKLEDIMDALMTTDEDQIIVRDDLGKRLGWFRLVYGNDPDEVINDFSANDWCEGIYREWDRSAAL